MAARKAFVWNLLLAAFFVADTQDTTAGQGPRASMPQSEVESTIDTTRCDAIAPGDTQPPPLTTVCRFALTYRYNLPDFVCEETVTTSGPQSASVQKLEVTIENGQERYSHISVSKNGRKTDSSASTDRTPFTSAGEFGSDLVNLFKMPTEPTFSPRKEALLRKTPSFVYEFHVAADKNAFWVLRDSNGMSLRPEYEGKLWLERANGQLVKLELRPVHLPKDFGLTSVHVVIDYRQTPIRELGMFLLPATATNTVCQRGWVPGPDPLGPAVSGVVCTDNIVVFHDCRKFASKVRILTEPSRR